jgi:flagellar motor switch/type III secretory pathway protein FliN
MSAAAKPAIETNAATSCSDTTEQALVPSAQSMSAGPVHASSRLMRLPVELEVAIPLRGFRVRNLLALKTGALVESQWTHGEDVPLVSGDVQLAWSEFDVLDTQMAVRLTRLV